METTSSTGSPRPPARPPSPEKIDSVLDKITLPAPPPTRHFEINISYEITNPDNCVSCLSGSCNQHGQLRESHEFPELHEIPVPKGNSDDDDKDGTSGVVPAPALQSSFFDESEDESESPSDDDDEIPEVGLASSDSEGEENEIEPENENAEALVLATYHLGPCGRLQQL